MIDNHVLPQIPDYVLGLLPVAERQTIEKHAATCPTCRQALQQESQIGQLVRAGLQTATQPPVGRLAQLMPTLPTRRVAPSFKLTWQLAVVSLLLFLIAGGLQLRPQSSVWQPAPSLVAVTATSTHTATATLAQIEATHEQEAPQTAVPAFYASPEWQATPSPVGTPVAALLNLSSN